MKNSKKVILLFAVTLLLIGLFALPVHAEGTITGFKQTAGTESSVTLKWNAYSGAAFYMVSYYVGDKVYTPVHTEQTSITLKLEKDSAYRCFISGWNRAGDKLLASSADIMITTVPGKISGFKASSWTTNGKSGVITWKKQQYSCMSGYQWQMYKGSKKKGAGTSTKMGFMVSLPSNTIYTLKVRPYVKTDDGTKLYGPWASEKILPQPMLKSGAWTADKNGVKLKWRKVSGATKYIIYGSTKKSSGYKKIASVSKKKSSYTVKKVKGKRLKNNQMYYIYVAAYYKKGSTKITSAHTIYWYGQKRA